MEKKKNQLLQNKRGMAGLLSVAIGFGIAIVTFVIVVVLLQNLSTANGITAGSYAFNVTTNGLTFSQNFSNQWGLAGTILGYVLILGILALVGVGGYMGYQKYKQGR